MVFEPARSYRSIAGQLLYFCCWLFVTAVGLVLTPSSDGHGTHQQLGLPPCPCVLLFNRPCPGCGLTTSFTNLLHGRIREAFIAHPFGPILYVTFTVTALMAITGFATKRFFNSNQKPFQQALVVFMFCFFAFGIYRLATSSHYQSPIESTIAAHIHAQ